MQLIQQLNYSQFDKMMTAFTNCVTAT